MDPLQSDQVNAVSDEFCYLARVFCIEVRKHRATSHTAAPAVYTRLLCCISLRNFHESSGKEYTIRVASPLYSFHFHSLPIYIPIATSRNELESNPWCSGLPTLMSSAKPLLSNRLTESIGGLEIDLVYVLQDERYANVSWISCIYHVLSYKMCVKWSNLK